MGAVVDVVALLAGVAIIVWGAGTFAENLASAAAHLGVTSFALALLLAGAEPEELATAMDRWPVRDRGSPDLDLSPFNGPRRRHS